MKKRLFIVLLMPILARGQNEKFASADSTCTGIQFEKKLHWQEIMTKAKKEGKYIFVDCFASWCLPCKKMDGEVFANNKVGDFVNAHFVSVQVQMDTSKNDDEYTRSWYSDAQSIQRHYRVLAVPTYLFFSPDGRFVHRYVSAMRDSDFIKIAANALEPDKQYCTLMDAYTNGRKDYLKMDYLARTAKFIGEDSVANVIAADYLHNYLDGLSESKLFDKKYLKFISRFAFLLTANDRIFKLYYKKGEDVDKLIGIKGYSQNQVLSIMTKEEITPRLSMDKKRGYIDPDWKGLKKAVKRKCNDYYAEMAVLNSQIVWYSQQKDTPRLIQCIVVKYEKYGLDTAGIGWALINNTAFYLFFRSCTNKDTLTKMIHWMEIIDKDHPEAQTNLDTYANLLYKTGRINEAISWEEKALRMEEQAAEKEKRNADPAYRETLEKMKNGIPTW